LTLEQNIQRLPVVNKNIMVDVKEFIAQREPDGCANDTCNCEYIV